MKKLFAIVLTVAMLLSLGSLAASATWVEMNGQPHEVETPGSVNIQWDPDFTDKITIDGDMTDWAIANYSVTTLALENFVSFDNVPCEDWSKYANFAVNAYFVADADNLYVGFWIIDEHPIASADATNYGSGDAFQIAIDFNNVLRDTMEQPNWEELIDEPQSIFYSFARYQDGEPLTITRQNRSRGESTQLTGEDGVNGVAKTTSDGWCAEFALPWNLLAEDATYKAWADDYMAKLDDTHDLELGILLCYLNKDSDETRANTFAVGTFNNEHPTWTPAENGLSLKLTYQTGMILNTDFIASPGEDIYNTNEDPTDPVDPPAVTDPETDAATEPATEAKTEAETDAATEGKTEAKTEETKAEGTKAETDKPAESGCASVVGVGVAAVVLSAVAAGVALKKKED